MGMLKNSSLSEGLTTEGNEAREKIYEIWEPTHERCRNLISFNHPFCVIACESISKLAVHLIHVDKTTEASWTSLDLDERRISFFYVPVHDLNVQKRLPLVDH